MPPTADETKKRPPVGIVDCDVHHEWASGDSLISYLSSGWREFVRSTHQLDGRGHYPLTAAALFPHPVGSHRADSYPANEALPGSSYDLMADQLLDRHHVDRAVLTYGQGMFVGGLGNPHLATEVARATNDWSIDEWLDRDSRLCSAVLVATHLPELAAAEIRRVGGHQRMVEVLLASNGVGKPFGHPLFHPIYRAAAELDLPIAIHIGGDAFGAMQSPIAAGGPPSFYIEQHMLVPQAIQTHLLSFIVHGVFAKFPTLRLLLVEAGVAWLPWFVWRLDAEYRGLRREVPWLTRPPSEYIYEHVRLTTQPFEVPSSADGFIDALGAIGGADLLCFATDYPHWDADEPDHIANSVPASWHEKVFRANASKLYGWTQTERDGRLQGKE